MPLNGYLILQEGETMMKINKWLIVLVILSIIATIVIYPKLPDKIPMHWNFKGEIDGYGNRTSVFATATLPLILYVLMVFIPRIDPKKESYKKHAKAYEITILAMTLLFILLHWITISVGLGYEIPVDMIVKICIGILFIIIGNYMGQIRHNYFFGIRTPWTLASETSWRKTHKIGGIGFIIVGILFVIASPIRNQLFSMLCFVALMILIVIVTVYSYFVYKKDSQ